MNPLQAVRRESSPMELMQEDEQQAGRHECDDDPTCAHSALPDVGAVRHREHPGLDGLEWPGWAVDHALNLVELVGLAY